MGLLRATASNRQFHLLAMANEAGIDLNIQDFDTIGSKVPLLANVSPHGKYHMVDIDNNGGIAAINWRYLDNFVTKCYGFLVYSS